jgi:hypothetical protein
MALPQQVVEQLNQGSERTPGWSSGIILFAGSILFIVVFIYAGLKFGYEKYLNNQNDALTAQAQTVGKQVSPADETNLVRFYSQVINLESLVKNHVYFSQFLTWIEQNTEANVYYGNISFAAGNQITLSAFAKTSADVSQQFSIFESSPEVSMASLSNVNFSPTANEWAFNVVLNMKPDVLLWNPTLAASASTVPTVLSTSTATGTVGPVVSGLATTTATTTP